MAISKIVQNSVDTGVAGTGPAFAAYPSAAQTFSTATNTKITFDVENFDSNNSFSSSRFTPTVAGYYYFTINFSTTGSGGFFITPMIFKNGSSYTGNNYNHSGGYMALTTSNLVYMNGSTDYVEAYLYQASGSNQNNLAGRGDLNNFCGYMVRAA